MLTIHYTCIKHFMLTRVLFSEKDLFHLTITCAAIAVISIGALRAARVSNVSRLATARA